MYRPMGQKREPIKTQTPPVSPGHGKIGAAPKGTSLSLLSLLLHIVWRGAMLLVKKVNCGAKLPRFKSQPHH